MIISQFPTSGGSGGALPLFTYTGKYTAMFDSGGWKIKFLTSGVLLMLSTADVDIFLVGGGGNGSNYSAATRRTDSQGKTYYTYQYGGGGGSGYTLTQKNIRILAGAHYNIQVGESGEDSYIQPQTANEWEVSAYTAAHGISGENSGAHQGGNGGSGGAEPNFYAIYTNGSYYDGSKSREGAQDGGSKTSAGGGTGQGTTTREFGEPSGELYANGGGSGYRSIDAPAIIPNTGNGGFGGNSGAGASGIVIIRNAR